MKTLLIKTKVILLSAIIFLASCTSHTMIYSNPPAKVIIGGKEKGETPYYHKDMKLSFMSTKIKLERNGYQSRVEKINRSGRINPFTLICSAFLFPIPWIGHYKLYYTYDLKSEGVVEKVKPDYIKYKEPFKLKSRLLDPIYIGEEDSYRYVYNDNHLIKMSKSFRLKETKEIFDSKLSLNITPIDAFIKNNKKYVLGFKKGQNVLSAITIEKSGKSNFVELTEILNKGRILCPDYKYGYDRAADGEVFIAYNDAKITMFDINLNRRKTYVTENEKVIVEAEITSDERVFSLQMNTKEVTLHQNGAGEKEIKVELVSGRNMNYFRMNVDETLNKAFVTYLVSPTVVNPELSPRKQRKKEEEEEFVSEGVHFIEYDLSTLTKTESKTIFFEKEIVSKGYFNSEKGIKFLINQGVVADENNSFINLEEQWIISGGSVDALKARGLITINASRTDNPMVFISKSGSSHYDFNRLTYNQILKNGKLHYLFNDNIFTGTKPIVQQITIDSDMNFLSQDVKALYKEEKTFVNTANSYELEEGERLFFHYNQKKFGAGIIDFE